MAVRCEARLHHTTRGCDAGNRPALALTRAFTDESSFAAGRVSALLTELDAERERLRCGECGGPMVRRLRPLKTLWLLGRLRVVRGYWTRGCAGRPLSAGRRVGGGGTVQDAGDARPALGGGAAGGGDELRAGGDAGEPAAGVRPEREVDGAGILQGARETAADGPCRLNRRVRTNMSYTRATVAHGENACRHATFGLSAWRTQSMGYASHMEDMPAESGSWARGVEQRRSTHPSVCGKSQVIK